MVGASNLGTELADSPGASWHPPHSHAAVGSASEQLDASVSWSEFRKPSGLGTSVLGIFMSSELTANKRKTDLYISGGFFTAKFTCTKQGQA